MSRRHHGRPHHHAVGGPEGQRRIAGLSPGALDGPAPKPNGDATMNGSRPPTPIQGTSPIDAPEARPPFQPEPTRDPIAPVPPPVHHDAPPAGGPGALPTADPGPAPTMAANRGGPPPMPAGPMNGVPGLNAQCTAPQLRRFIKSRPYVPMHELRRRFGIDGGDDDVTPVRLELGWVYVGLPTREGGLLGELLKAGEIGYELSLDPRTPIVIGIYPMRPIPRS
jgi:hypothetical protein